MGDDTNIFFEPLSYILSDIPSQGSMETFWNHIKSINKLLKESPIMAIYRDVFLATYAVGVVDYILKKKNQYACQNVRFLRIYL